MKITKPNKIKGMKNDIEKQKDSSLLKEQAGKCCLHHEVSPASQEAVATMKTAPGQLAAHHNGKIGSASYRNCPSNFYNILKINYHENK
jgi:hypothetical protein